MVNEIINEIYRILSNEYPHDNWWPIFSNDSRKDSNRGLDQLSEDNKFEIMIGAILTQNTNWLSVDKALSNILRFTDFNCEHILNFIDEDPDKFKDCIKPTGYFNQKTFYIKSLGEFFLSLNGKTPSRKELLSVKGVGNETADTILLYAYGEKEFVVDAYTKRILLHLGLINEKATYYQIKKLFEDNFEGDVNDYQSYHGLIVDHAKLYYRQKPYGANDTLLNILKR